MREECVGDAPCQFCGSARIICGDRSHQRSEQLRARIGVIFLDGLQRGEGRLQSPLARPSGAQASANVVTSRQLSARAEWMSRN
jgi:hypothetical protein